LAVYGLQADIDANPAKGVQLYVPGQTQLTSKDVFLGGVATGINDTMLNGATRVWGDDRYGTANAYDAYLKGQTGNTQLQNQTNLLQSQLGSLSNDYYNLYNKKSTANTVSSGNPMLDIIGSDPEAAAMYNQALLAAKTGSKNAMETLNTRGILNSSVTSDAVTGLEQEAMTNVLSQLYNLEYQKKQQEVTNAFNRLNTLGYADNEVAKVLGITVGTPSASYNLSQAQLTGNLNGQQTMQGQQSQLSNTYQGMVNQYYPQVATGQISGQNLQNTYQSLINQGYPAEQAAKIAGMNAQTAATYNNMNTSNASGASGQLSLNDVVSNIYSDIYSRPVYDSGQPGVEPGAINQLIQSKAEILSALTSAGMKYSDALEFYNSVYSDLTSGG